MRSSPPSSRAANRAGGNPTNRASTAPVGAIDARIAAREIRRTQLLDAAIEVVRREGPFVSMEQIASESGITKPIIYRHFVDREGLVEAMAERFVDELITSLGPSMHQQAEPIDLLTATVDAYLALIEREHHLYRFLSSQPGPDRRDVMAGLVAEEVAIIIEQLLADRSLPVGPARTWAYGLVGMVHFAGDWWATAAAANPADAVPRADIVHHLTAVLWQGFDRLGLGEQPPEPPDPRARPRNSSTTRSHRKPSR